MNQKGKLALALALLLIAVVIFARMTVMNPDNKPTPGSTMTAEKQIADIEANDKMPPQAKAAAIAQIRARAGAGVPGGPTSTGGK